MNINQNNNQSYMLQVNEIISSICEMTYHSIQSQLKTYHNIVRQLLRNDLVFHFKSPNAIKLLAYELIIMLAEEESIGKRTRIQKFQQKFHENKKVKLTVQMKNVLSSIRSLLEEIIWKNRRSRGSHEVEGKNEKMQEYFNQFSDLLSDFNKKLKLQPQNEEDENEVLIQQLEAIIAKKQKRIKELSDEYEENIIDQKELEDLTEELQIRNDELTREVEELKAKLKEADVQIIMLEDKIEDLQNESKILKIEKKKQTKDSLKLEEFEESQELISKALQREEKKEEEQGKGLEEMEQMQRILLIQSLSIEAMI